MMRLTEETKMNVEEPMVIETTHVYSLGDPDGHYTFRLPNGKLCTIGNNDKDFFDQLRELPAETILKIFRVREEDAFTYFEGQKTVVKKFLSDLLAKKWHYRDTDCFFTGEKGLISGFKDLSVADIKKKLKSKNSFTYNQLNSLIDFFVGDRAEIYQKDSR